MILRILLAESPPVCAALVYLVVLYQSGAAGTDARCGGTRDVEAGDEVVVKLPVGFTGSSTDSIGVCSIKTLAQVLFLQYPQALIWDYEVLKRVPEP
eukprot:1497221-Rhodomonas_salina.3